MKNYSKRRRAKRNSNRKLKRVLRGKQKTVTLHRGYEDGNFEFSDIELWKKGGK
ncbi:MAG TPA: hypothetical protein PKK94_05365 [Leptospiraceae bacterium]|nr:hypothetical protein [Leptospiraceae bacterium]